MSFPPTNCACLKPFDLESAIEKVYKNKMTELENEVSARLNSVVLITCYECLGSVSLLKKPQTYEYIRITSEIHKISITEEEDNKINGRNTHIICHKCFLNNNSMEKIKDKDKYIIKCKICEINHFVDKNEMKKINIDRDKVCCLIF